MLLKRIAIAGATGRVGSAVTKALADCTRFEVTALTRGGSSNRLAGVTYVTVDFENQACLVEALKGHDAVVCALNNQFNDQQRNLIDASVQAGVARFLPSEFGSDTINPLAARLPVFASKKSTQTYLEGLAASGKISYTLVITGPLLDMGLEYKFLGVDPKDKIARTLNGGDAKFSTSTKAGVGAAVVAILDKAEETINRAVYTQSTALSQKELTARAKEVTGSHGWTEVDAGTTQELEQECYKKMESGVKDMSVQIGFLQSAIFTPGYGGYFEKLDNDLLGLEELSDEQIVEVIKTVAMSK